MKKPRLGILLGDAAGIGPEIIAKLCAEDFFKEHCHALLIGDSRILARALEVIGCGKKVPVVTEEACMQGEIPALCLLDLQDTDPADVPFGQGSRVSGAGSLAQIDCAVALCVKGVLDGIAFAPFTKAMLKEAGCPCASEMEYMAELFQMEDAPGEINVVKDVFTTRVTSHIPVSEIASRLSVRGIADSIRLLQETLTGAGVASPRIAVAALNPHAGENGTCGREEIDVILPAIEEAAAEGINVTGPFAADTVFVRAFHGDFDGVVTMYHDQGQIAMKVTGFGEGVTIGGGFPYPVTTCGHGSGYDIAGTGKAVTGSMKNAVIFASRMAI